MVTFYTNTSHKDDLDSQSNLMHVVVFSLMSNMAETEIGSLNDTHMEELVLY